MLSTIDFDFAFSFAGEDRGVVQEIYSRLTADGIKVFYDSAYQTQLIGQDLYRGLRELYKNNAKYIVCFISEHYAKKAWTNLEFTAVKERLMSTFFASSFLIPVIIDKTQMLEDIPNFISFYTHTSIDATVKMLNEKIKSSISENHFITNVNNCITYICSQIQHQLQANNVNSSLVNTDEIIINQDGNRITYLFSSDTIAPIPCILIIKREGNPFNKVFKSNPFPSLVITWKKEDGLYFSIHEFNSCNSKAVINQSLNETVKNISSILEKDIRRSIY